MMDPVLANNCSDLQPELGTRYLKSGTAAAIWQNKQRHCRLLLLKLKSSAAATTCLQNNGRCRYFRKISSKRNDGIQIQYPMVKFQLYLRKLQFKLLKYWYMLQSTLAGLNDK